MAQRPEEELFESIIRYFKNSSETVNIKFENFKEIKRENWMFKLVGQEVFTIGKHKCVISIESASGFTYEYSLQVDNKSYEKFCENQSKVLQAWTFIIHDVQYRIALEKSTMDIWINGERIEAEVIFIQLFLII